jgi:catechol 2,3-dioxygenase-like lactoylglutathione lyase family enzyme
VINGMHALLYSTDAAADRAFLRDVLGWSFVEDHPGWLIFALPPGELGVHPLDAGAAPRHELYLMCDDVHATVRELTEKGATFAGDVEDQGFGLMVRLLLPGGSGIGLYEPRHQIAADIRP